MTEAQKYEIARLKAHFGYYNRFTIDYSSDEQMTERRNCIAHLHNTAELVIVEKGVSTIIIDREITKAEGSFAILYPANTIHQQLNEAAHPYSRYCMSLDKSYFSHETEIPDSPFVISLSESELSRLTVPAKMLFDMNHDKTSSQKLSFARCESLLTLILAELYDIKENSAGTLPSSKSYICEVCRYIEQNIGKKLTIDELSAKFFVCRAKLTRDFRSGLGMSVGEYITISRVGQSKQLLVNGLGLGEISTICGFSDTAHYVRTFQKICGETPAVFRKRAILCGRTQKIFWTSLEKFTNL